MYRNLTVKNPAKHPLAWS